MTHEEIDVMWQQATRQSIEDGEVYTRYRFAKLVAAKSFQNGYVKGVAAFNDAVLLEREACAKVCDLVAREMDDTNGTTSYVGKLIRARGQE